MLLTCCVYIGCILYVCVCMTSACCMYVVHRLRVSCVYNIRDTYTRQTHYVLRTYTQHTHDLHKTDKHHTPDVYTVLHTWRAQHTRNIHITYIHRTQNMCVAWWCVRPVCPLCLLHECCVYIDGFCTRCVLSGNIQRMLTLCRCECVTCVFCVGVLVLWLCVVCTLPVRFNNVVFDLCTHIVCPFILCFVYDVCMSCVCGGYILCLL